MEEHSGQLNSNGGTTSIQKVGSGEALALCSQAEARTLLKEVDALQMCALPLGISSTRQDSLSRRVVTIAVPDTCSAVVLQGLRFATGCEVHAIHASEKDIRDAIFRAYRGDQSRFAQAVDRVVSLPVEIKDLRGKISLHQGDGPVIELVKRIVDFAAARSATDIHLSPSASGTQLSFREKGELFRFAEPVARPDQHRQIANRLKVVSQLEVGERDQAQEGSFEVDGPHGRLGVRVSIMPTIFGENIVLRLIGHWIHSRLSDLGHSEDVYSVLLDFISQDHGALIVVGPTGSGKTTLLYAIAQECSRRGASVSTLEDPVEAAVPGLHQTSIERWERGYQSALKAVLRQDPDVILLGELRDGVSGSIALEAALTGHQLLTTAHASTVTEALCRLQTLGVSLPLLAPAVWGIVAQQLVPLLCVHCREVDVASSAACGAAVSRSRGCPECKGTGISAQRPVAEVLNFNAQTRAYLRSGGTDYEEIPGERIHAKVELKRLLLEGEISFHTYRRRLSL